MAFSSSSVLAIIICLFAALEMASAWKSICIPGDIYIDSTAHAPIPKGLTCTFYKNWCDEQCSILGLPPVKYGCRLQNDIRCKCCCGSSPPSPSSPPSQPLPPPAPQSPSEFEGEWPHMYEICTDGQENLIFNHDNGTECVSKPKCEKECRDVGLLMARKECVAGGESYPRPWYKWYEQCCCKTPPPPPPSPPPPPPPSPPPPPPSPPPPSPPPPPPPPSPSGRTCKSELSIRISPGQEPCTYQLLN
ncbi:hypothetical protein MKX03_017999 [Papaver bracteatum]|nr:hypothetical protein MKX03_017999 [Papaver bracteatum]